MLEEARARVAAAGLAGRVELRRLTAMEVDTLPPGSFDFVVSTLVLSELSEAEADFVLRAARGLLAPGGAVLVADEEAPSGRLGRWAYAATRLPLQLVTYLATQARSLPAAGWARTLLYFVIELPLMLLVFFVVPPGSRALSDLAGTLARAGLRPLAVRSFLGGTLKLVEGGVP
jgi:demethylmenaquinone methyltransferase/2-methoxy-6-polyprenyl-1,4-benzoquinol methylase